MNTDFLAALAIVLLLFLIGREVVCWYLKINHRLDLLEEIRDLLKEAKEPISTTVKVASKKNPVKAEEDFFYKKNEKSKVMKVSDGEISIVNLDEKNK